jgi:hypothetical protein
MFKSAMSKGSFVHGLLSFLFTVLENKNAFHQRLLQISESHCKKGVKAIEYGIIGEVGRNLSLNVLFLIHIYSHVLF